MKKIATLATILILGLAATACSPKVGSEKWCKSLEKKEKGDWTASEAADYMKHCVMK